MSSAAVMRMPRLSSDVEDSAGREGVQVYLPSVMEMTERVFPDAARITVNVEEDPEIPDDAHLLFEVYLPAIDGEQYVDAKFRWGQELFLICPAPLVCVFRCRLRIYES